LATNPPVYQVTANQKTWKPHPKQVKFLELPDEIFEGFFGGSAGPGKSEVILMYPIARKLIDHPRFKGIIFRRTYPELEESLIPRSFEWYPYFGGKYNASKHVWIFPSGASIRFGYSDNENDVRQHDTAEYNYLGIDELTHFTEFQYLYLTHRVRTSVAGLPSIVRSASNPGNVGHAWVRERFILPKRQGFAIIKDSKTGAKRIYIPAYLHDNPTLVQNDPTYMDRLRLLPEAERKAKLEGDWDAFSGQVFTEFRYSKLHNEPENYIHVIPPFDNTPSFGIPSWWPKVLSVDWGHQHKTSALWSAISPDGRVYIYREFAEAKRKIADWGAQIARLSQFDENIVEMVLDPSAWQDRGLPYTIADQLMEVTGFNFSRADNDRLGGKHLIHEYLRCSEKPPRKDIIGQVNVEYGQYILRTRGSDAFWAYMKSFEPVKPETNLPKLQIFNHCTDLITTIPLLVYDDGEGKNLIRSEDVKKMKGDDGYDSLRYNLKAIDAYLTNSAKEAKRRKDLEGIISIAEKDQTAFYQRMDRFEKQNSLPISRGSRVRRGYGRRKMGA
jgi:hypothetical protein